MFKVFHALYYRAIRPGLVSIYGVIYKWNKNARRARFALATMHRRILFSQALQRYLNGESLKKLQIGSGDNMLEGWFNTDLYPRKGFFYLNAEKPFPIKDGVFDRIFSEHMIEHISYSKARSQLEEWYRALRPGGRIRIATPNLEFYISLFDSSNVDTERERYKTWVTKNWLASYGVNDAPPSMFINLVMRSWGHLFIYDKETLAGLLEEVGFIDVSQFRSQESEDESFTNIERHGFLIGNPEANTLETLVLEAEKPSRDL